jgi:putative nucleotidyltransferase with HDIG domain
MLETLASQAAIAIENARLFEDTQRIYYETLKSLARALEARDDYTRGHSERVADLSLAIAQDLGLDDEQLHLIYNSALLHDIGKIGVRDAILLKPRKLTEQEMAVIRKHPTFGNAILGPLKFLGEVSELVKHHHERWDGTGYPSGLKGEAIPLASRIIAVADTYDAMTSTRPYRAAIPHQDAIDEIRREAGSQLDPTVVEAFLRVVERRMGDAVGSGKQLSAPPPPKPGSGPPPVPPAPGS